MTFLYALMFGIGVGGWVAAKVGRNTGHADPKAIALTGVGAGTVAFLVFLSIFKLFLHM